MANGDIPVTGSAVTLSGTGTTETFKIEAAGGQQDGLNHLLVRTQGKGFQIFVDTGTETFGPKPIDKHKWQLRIEPIP
jgi:hypothetical protein